MVKKATLNEAWDEVDRAERTYWPEKRPNALVLADIVSEVGELADIIKVMAGYGSKPKHYARKHLVEETIDVAASLFVFAQKNDIGKEEFAQALVDKMKVVDRRMSRRKFAKLMALNRSLHREKK